MRYFRDWIGLCAFKIFTVVFLLLLAFRPYKAGAYSILTHEAIVDACWQRSFVPFLKLRYPGITEDELAKAHAYAYGGSIAPDMGYFPMGSKLFTDLAHYVRSGDLVVALMDEAQTANELSFALGFLTHYMADIYGHGMGINRAVALVYPKIEKKYGRLVTYADDKLSHKRVEFSFDVLQVSQGNYASEEYHDFIGFALSGELLEKAVRKVYGLELRQLFPHFSFSVRILRMTVISLFPAITQSAWLIHKNKLRKQGSTTADKDFRNRMRRLNYYQDSGLQHRKPTFFLHLFSWFIRVVPKIGPLRSLKIKAPGEMAEALFRNSFDTVTRHFNREIQNIKKEVSSFPNKDLDTGEPTRPLEYKLADKTYAAWLLKLRKGHFRLLNNGIRDNILAFYSHFSGSIASGEEVENDKKLAEALVILSLR